MPFFWNAMAGVTVITLLKAIHDTSLSTVVWVYKVRWVGEWWNWLEMSGMKWSEVNEVKWVWWVVSKVSGWVSEPVIEWVGEDWRARQWLFVSAWRTVPTFHAWPVHRNRKWERGETWGNNRSEENEVAQVSRPPTLGVLKPSNCHCRAIMVRVSVMSTLTSCGWFSLASIVVIGICTCMVGYIWLFLWGSKGTWTLTRAQQRANTATTSYFCHCFQSGCRQVGGGWWRYIISYPLFCPWNRGST